MVAMRAVSAAPRVIAFSASLRGSLGEGSLHIGSRCGTLQLAHRRGLGDATARGPRRRAHWLASAVERPRAAALVIGNEILNGSTLDTNTQTLAKFLFRRGVTLARAETIPDDVPTIGKAAARLAATHDYVFTSGGIGPTLDDVTYEALAKAFGISLEQHGPTIARMRQISPDMDLNAARMRMATLPAGCRTLWTDGLWVPTVVVGGNVFVLPGIPKLYGQMLHAIPEDVVGAGSGISARVTAQILTNLSEGTVAELLDQVSEQYPDVVLGSYPQDKTQVGIAHRTKLTLEADTPEEISEAHAVLQDLVSAVESPSRL